MARNAEKAMTTLARWRAAQDGGIQMKARRPYLASECEDLREAEKWRNQVISEIARKVSQIQNAGLGEFRIRDLNDEINKLLREKGHWEIRIKELGGPDYNKVGPKITDMDGQEAPGNRGYIYFGAAKDLPGVRELFEQEPPPPPRKTRGELMKNIDADYYGYRDEDDGLLIPSEVKQERKVIRQEVKKYSRKKAKELDSTVIDTKDDSTVIDTKDDSTVIDTKDDNTVIDTKDDNTVIDTKDDNTVMDTKDDNTVMDTKDDNTVMDTKDDNTVMDTKDDNTVMDTKDDNTVMDTKDDLVDMSDNEDDLDDIVDVSMEGLDERSEVLRFMAHVPNIPTQADIEAAMVQNKKNELLKMFLGDGEDEDEDDDGDGDDSS